LTDPKAALEVATKIEISLEQYFQDAHNSDIYGSILHIKGEALNRLNDYKGAAILLDRALSLPGIDKTTSGFADLLSARASSARGDGDYAAALRGLHAAYKLYLDSDNKRSAIVSYLRIGQVYDDAGQYDKSLQYYSAGSEYSDDLNLQLTALNNIAKVYLALGRNAEAKTNFLLALELADQLQSSSLKERILANLAMVYLAQGELSEADRIASQGIAVADLSGEAQWSPALWGVRARVAFLQGDFNKSETLLEKVFEGQNIEDTSASFRELHRYAFETFNSSGQFQLATRHLVAFKRLDDEARDVAANANTALMGAQFDFAKQELEISELKSETLQKEVEIARAQARQRTIALTFGVVLVLLGSGGGLVHYRSVIRSRNHIRRKNDELNQSNAFLEKALKAKSEFLATTSHEIRTPLNGILGTTQVLIHSSRMPADVRERVELIQIAGEAMKGIVDDLLDVAKMESGSIELVEDRFDLRAALSDVARFWSDSAVRKGLNLEADLDACPGLVIGDERRLRQVVYNLLSNAVKFTDHGFVRLCARPDPDALDHLLVEVADTGCGIPEEELEKIFAPFHQVDGGKTRRHGGTGLGLSICQNLASALGGRVAVTSEVGEGSSFILRVPLKRAEAAPPVMSLAAGAGDVEQDQAQRLLVISDNAAASAALQIPMAMRDVEFDLVETLPEALETLNSRRFSGLLLVSSVLGEDPGDGMEKLMNLHEASHEACLAVWLAEESLLTAPMLRLSGASSVLEGKFDAETILDWVLNEEVSSTENQEMSFIGKAVSGA